MSGPALVLTDQPTDDDGQVIGNGLADFNAAQTGYRDSRKLAALARDPRTGETLGGMFGRTSYGMLFIELVWLPDTLRGQDIGGRLLRMMEDEATRRGCMSAVLLTITFQAPGFYARHGWREFGRVPCHPPGAARVFMTKSLGDAAARDDTNAPGDARSPGNTDSLGGTVSRDDTNARGEARSPGDINSLRAAAGRAAELRP